ncbi:RAP domain-containing protein, partial [Endozoicomonas acroporae]
NLLWAMAKLVDNGQKWSPEFYGAVAALLPHVIARKDQFTSQHIVNLLWVMAKLLDNGQEWTPPELKEAVAALLSQVNEHKDQFNAQHIANLLWAMAKLSDNGQEQTPEFSATVAVLLPHVKAQKANFKPQEIAILLWAMAKLVDNRQEQATGLMEAVVALLPLVNAKKDQFNAQGVTNLLWAVAKLVDNGQEQTPVLKEAVVALLPQVNAQKDQFNAQGIANLLWAMVKLVDDVQEPTPELKKAVTTLLPQVNEQKANFKPQEIANLLWATAKLVDDVQEQTLEFKEAVTALLPHVNAQKANFKPQEIAVLLWAMAKPGELVELNLVTSIFKSLVHKISENPQLSQKAILMSLWGVMVCCARLSLVSTANKYNVLEKHMDDLFTRLENTSPDNEEDQTIIAMAASWLGRVCPLDPHYPTMTSKPQTVVRNQLQSCMPSLKIEEEKSLNSLPPVDLLLPDHNIVIEVQGPSHYVSGDFKTRKGSTLLKIALLQKAGFEVIEIPANQLWHQDLRKPFIDQIKARVNILPQSHGSVALNIGWADETLVTADKAWQPSDHCYLTIEERLKEQTGKPGNRMKKNSP